MEDFFPAVVEILRNLTPEFVESVFEGWIEQLNQVIDTDGDYIQSQ
jgi:hypothetical protein